MIKQERRSEKFFQTCFILSVVTCSRTHEPTALCIYQLSLDHSIIIIVLLTLAQTWALQQGDTLFLVSAVVTFSIC